MVNISLNVCGETPEIVYDENGYHIEDVSWNPITNEAYVLASSSQGFGDWIHVYKNNILVNEIENPIHGRTIAWRPDGSYAIIAGTASSIVIYNDTTKKQIDVPASYESYDISWKPDGTEALIAGYKLIRFNALSESIDSTYNISFEAVAWRPDGAFALIASSNGGIHKFEDGVITEITPSFSSSSFNIQSISWKPDNDLNDGYQGYALLCGSHNTVMRYDDSEFQILSSRSDYCSNDTFQSLDSYPTHRFQDIAWAPSGEYALLVGNEGVVFYNRTIIQRLAYDVNFTFLCCSWDIYGQACYVGGFRSYIDSATTKFTADGGLYMISSEDIKRINIESTVIIDERPDWAVPLVAGSMVCILSSVSWLYLYHRKNYHNQ